MNCPKCEISSLAPKVVAGVEVDCCAQCQGIWFDDRELEHLLDLDRRTLKPLIGGKETESVNMKRSCCPRDGAELLRVSSAQDPTLILDTCVDCNGVWLDGGELKRLVRH